MGLKLARERWTRAILAATLVAAPALLWADSEAGAEQWRFALVSDTQDVGGDVDGVSRTVVRSIARDIANNRDVDLVIHAGDAVVGQTGAAQNTLATMFETFKTAMSEGGLSLAGSGGAGVPYYVVRGNHDTYALAGTDADAAWRGAFGTLPQNGPATASGGGGSSEVGMTYSFTHNNAIFLALDEFENAASTAQPVVNQTWINQQLSGNTQPHVFAFGHTPVFNLGHNECLAWNQPMQEAFLTSLHEAGGRVYFAGHDHLQAVGRGYADGTQDFYQVISASCGPGGINWPGGYNGDYPGDAAVVDVFHTSGTSTASPTFYYGYSVVTVDDNGLWVHLYGTRTKTDPATYSRLYTALIWGTMPVDTSTLTGNVNASGSVRFDQLTNGTYTGVISGTGGVDKYGSGTLTLSGNSTMTGATHVHEGTLAVNGTNSSSAVTVYPGGALQGTGRVLGVQNNGTVRPGNSIGDLNLGGGAFTQTSGGTLEIELQQPGPTYDRILNASTATLAGTLRTIVLAGSFSAGDTLSGVIQTAGGVTGSFDFLDTQITPTLVWQPVVNGNNLDLVAGRQYDNDVLLTRLSYNQRQTAQLMQRLLPGASGDLAAVRSAIEGLGTNESVADAYSQISPERYSAMSTAAFSDATGHFEALQQHLRRLRARQRGGWYSEADGGLGDKDATDNQPGFDYSSGGSRVGYDRRMSKRFFGGARVGYSGLFGSMGGPGGDLGADAVTYGLYGTYAGREGAYADFSLEGISRFYDLSRRIEFGGLSRDAAASPSGQQWTAAAGFGFDRRFGGVTTGPSFTIKYSRLRIDGFTESGADSLNLAVSGQRAESCQLGFGWRASGDLPIGGLILSSHAGVSYQRELKDESRVIEAELSGAPFHAQTDEPSDDFLLVSAGLTAPLSESAYLYLSYQIQAGQDQYLVHRIDGGYKNEF